MNAVEKIKKVLVDEIESLEKALKRHGEQLNNNTPVFDANNVNFKDKIKILNQFIRTIEEMERRGEFSEPEGLQRVVKDYLTGSHLENDSD